VYLLFQKRCHLYEPFCGRHDRIETALKTSDTVHYDALADARAL
jgi:hypothetical protein